MSKVYDDIKRGLDEALLSESLIGVLSERAATCKVSRNEDGKVVIEDVTGAELHPGDPKNCQGNGSHPDHECCCDECDFYLDCFPEWEKGQSDD